MEALSLMPQTPCSGPRALDATGELRPDDAVDDREVPGCPLMRSVSVHLLAFSDKCDKLQPCGCQEHGAHSPLNLQARQPAPININDLTQAESVPSGGHDCQATAVLSTQAPLSMCLRMSARFACHAHTPCSGPRALDATEELRPAGAAGLAGSPTSNREPHSQLHLHKCHNTCHQ